MSNARTLAQRIARLFGERAAEPAAIPTIPRPRFCRDCAWIEQSGLSVPYCVSPQADLDLVTGDRKRSPCELVRIYAKECGPDGRWWEARV